MVASGKRIRGGHAAPATEVRTGWLRQGETTKLTTFYSIEDAMKILDVVATLQDFPEQRSKKFRLRPWSKELDSDHVLVEFADGVAYALSPIQWDN